MREFRMRGGHMKPLWAGHPWVYAEGAKETTRPAGGGDPAAQDVARVVDGSGRTIGWGLVSERSAIRVRLLGWGEPTRTAEEQIERRLEEAVALRQRLFPRPSHTSAYRLVHADGDGLPGLVVDRHGSVLVAQFATRPMHRRREMIAEHLLALTGARSLLSREAGYEDEEGIPDAERGFRAGAETPERVRVAEEGMVFDIEPRLGQKTGHYADQRENRLRVAEVSADANVLDLYAGTGGFSVQALRRGARSSLAVEASARAGDGARHAARLNAVEGGLDVLTADVRATLRELKQTGRVFDVVVCDPPNFFPKRGGPGHALKAYRDVNVQALTRVEDGGVLATFTCSARLPPGEFFELVRSCARECRRRLRVLRELSAGPDHPTAAAAPEGRYLTGLLALVDG